jgi:hypothetical protein
MKIVTITRDSLLTTQLRQTIAANIALGKAEKLLEPLSAEARAWVLRKLAERLGLKEMK